MSKRIICIFAVAALIVSMPVYAAGDAPVTQNSTETVTKNTPKNITLAATDDTLQPELLTYTIVSNPANGALSEVSSGVYTYTPNEGFTGADGFTFKANDGDTDSNVSTVTINVTEPPSVPTAESFTLSVVRNTPKTWELEGDDPEDRPLAFAIVDQPTKGEISSFNASNGVFEYTPEQNLMGADSFTFTVTAGGTVSAPATVTVNIDMQVFTGNDLMKYADLEGHWAANTVGQLGSMNMIRGESIHRVSYFHPGAEMTRAEFILFLSAVFELEPSESESSEFSDVSQSWLVGPLNAAKDVNIISGSGGAFNPNAFITRAEAAVCVAKALNLPVDAEAELTFNDVGDVPSWCIQHLKNLSGYSIITGYDDGYFRPNKTMTRAEGAVVLYKAYKERLLQLSAIAEAEAD